MGIETEIGWTQSTFNVWRGCIEDAGSLACDFCYAKAMSRRNPKMLGVWGSVEDGGVRAVAAEKYWAEPLKWNKAAEKAGGSHLVFCASLADVFEEWDGPMHDHLGRKLYRNAGLWSAADELIAEEQINHPVTMQDVRIRLFKLIDKTPWLRWQLLTKRPQNIARMWPKLEHHIHDEWGSNPVAHRPNVWLGCTVEDQKHADRRIPELLKCHALSPVLFLSAEPLLGPIDLEQAHRTKEILPNWPEPTRVDWVIGGCESGPHARPSEQQWFESLRDQCGSKGVPFFMKQAMVGGTLVKQIDELPEGLRIQEVPSA